MFYGSSRDNHAVELLFAQQLEVVVEGLHVLHRGVLGSVALDLHEREFELQGGVGEHAHQVGLRCNLDGHEVQHHDA
jgi:hypothetical protein